MCTNAYTTDVVPSLAGSFLPLTAYGLALAPLPEPLRGEILPCGGALMQLPTGFHPFLVDGLGRIVTSLLPGPLRPQSASAPLRARRRRRPGRVATRRSGPRAACRSRASSA